MARVDRERLPPLAASRWARRVDALELVGVGANVVVRCLAGGEAIYLRLAPEALRPVAAVEAATDYLRHLSAAGAAVCTPLASHAGRLVEVVECDGERFVASAVAAVAGRPIDPLAAGPEVYASWGGALGALHAAAASYRAGDREFAVWDAVWARTGARLAAGDAPALRAWRELDAWRQTLPRDPSAYGLTHGDLRAGNALWDGRRVRIVDFDEPVWSWWAADVARSAIEPSELPAARRRALRDAFVCGYREARPLPDAQVEALPQFARMKALEMWAWAEAEWRGDVLPGGDRRDEHLPKLRRLFESSG